MTSSNIVFSEFVIRNRSIKKQIGTLLQCLHIANMNIRPDIGYLCFKQKVFVNHLSETNISLWLPNMVGFRVHVTAYRYRKICKFIV